MMQHPRYFENTMSDQVNVVFIFYSVNWSIHRMDYNITKGGISVIISKNFIKAYDF